jgi:hypothetical protein
VKVVVVTAFVVAGVAGCNLIPSIDAGTSSSGGGSTAAATGAGGSSAVVAQGSNCGVDPDTGATLCLGNSLCPGVTVSTEAFPACGFVVGGTVVDIECSCGYSLCPLGAATCALAQSLLAQRNEGSVCAQLSLGNCTAGTPTAASTSSTSSSGGTCNTACRDSCGGDPTCLEACGC